MAVVRAHHHEPAHLRYKVQPRKTTPVILTTPDEVETWLTSEARALQRPLPDGSLKIVARGVKEDGTV